MLLTSVSHISDLQRRNIEGEELHKGKLLKGGKNYRGERGHTEMFSSGIIPRGSLSVVNSK